MTFRKIHTRYLQRPPDGTKPWWFQNGRVDLFLWTRPDGRLEMIQCAHQEDERAEEVYADWSPATGARLGIVQGSGPEGGHRSVSPTIDFFRTPAETDARHLLDCAAECLAEIPEELRTQVADAITAMRNRAQERRTRRE